MDIEIIAKGLRFPEGPVAMRDGAVDFLQKPVNDRMLIDTVRRALRR